MPSEMMMKKKDMGMSREGKIKMLKTKMGIKGSGKSPMITKNNPYVKGK